MLRKLKLTPSERHSKDTVCLDGSVVPAGVPHLDVQDHRGGRRIAFGDIAEVVDRAHWRDAVRKGDMSPADDATKKLLAAEMKEAADRKAAALAAEKRASGAIATEKKGSER